MKARCSLGFYSGEGFRPVILVTGCGSGIGRALARLLVEQPRYRVVITARASSLAELQNEFADSDRVRVRALDLLDGGARDVLIDEIERDWGPINILVNNAGLSYRAVVEHMDETDERLQLETNYFGPAHLIKRVLPGMRRMGRGKIINVSSVSGMLAMPTMASYSASKYALEGFSEALWFEVKPFGIDVTLIQPGFVHSSSFLKVRYSKKSREQSIREGVYSDYYRNMTPFIERLMRLSLTTPEHVAQTILKVIKKQRPPLWVPATPDAWLFSYLRRLIPRRLLLPLLFQLLPRARRWARHYSNRRGR